MVWPRYECPFCRKLGYYSICNMDKCPVFFVAYYRGLDRYYNFIFAWRKMSREENFAKFHSKWILFSREENFAQNQNSRISRKLTPREKLVLYSKSYPLPTTRTKMCRKYFIPWVLRNCQYSQSLFTMRGNANIDLFRLRLTVARHHITSSRLCATIIWFIEGVIIAHFFSLLVPGSTIPVTVRPV